MMHSSSGCGEKMRAAARLPRGAVAPASKSAQLELFAGLYEARQRRHVLEVRIAATAD